ncbi:MAG: regulatory protein RecX [Bdellovibrionaceae bacterium]|nr:regulatory protein RecX [Pseudobdellovibrionaceae bacterium]
MPDRKPDHNPRDNRDSRDKKEKKETPAPDPRRKILDMVARRDHSPLEVKRKLSRKFTPEEVESAIAWAIENRWLPDSDETLKVYAEKWRSGLDRRKKGIRWMNQKLGTLGLPKIEADPETELEKARALVSRKLGTQAPTREVKAKLQRFLLSRGFEGETIRKALAELKS